MWNYDLHLLTLTGVFVQGAEQNNIPCPYYACAHLYAQLIRCLQRHMLSRLDFSPALQHTTRSVGHIRSHVFSFFLSFFLPSFLSSFARLQTWSWHVRVFLVRWILRWPQKACGAAVNLSTLNTPDPALCARVHLCVRARLSACLHLSFPFRVQGRLSRQPPSAFLNGRALSSLTGSGFFSGGQERLRREQTKRT